jgi:CBS domain-containing protein
MQMASIERHVVRKVIGLDPTTPCREAAKVMAEKRIGAVALVQSGKILGLVSERDLVGRCLVAGGSCEEPIARAMRGDLPSIHVKSSEIECTQQMRDHSTRHLLVADGDEIVGIISMRDVIVLMLDEKQFLIDQLNVYISGH